MRTSRDLLRPLAAILVVVAAMSLVANVAAFRAATTPSHVVSNGQHAGGGTTVGRARTADRPTTTRRTATRRGDDDSRTGEGDGDGDGRSRGGTRHVTVVARTGAS